MKRRLIVLLSLPVAILGIAFFLYLNFEDNRNASVSSDGINVYRTPNVEISNLDFRLMMAKKPEFVNISYNVHSITQNTTGLVTIDIPYDGMLTIPDNWSATKSNTSDSTLIYRLFNCSNTNPCTKDVNGQIVFTFSKGIEEKDRYHHSLKLNVKPSPFDSGISTIVSTVQQDVKLSLLDDIPYTIELFLDSKSDNIVQPLPTPDRQYSSSIFGFNSNVFSWNTGKGIDGLITIDYENPDERIIWMIVEYFLIPGGIAAGIPLIIEVMKLKGRFGSDDSTHQERKEHSKFLKDQVYKRLLDVYLRPEGGRKLGLKVPANYAQYQQDKLRNVVVLNDPPLISVSSLQYIDYAMRHLKHKKYKKILSHWKKIISILEEYNELVDSLSSKLKTIIENEMSTAFPDFIEFIGNGADNSYLSSNIVERLCRFHEYEHNIQQIDLNPVNSGNSDYRIMSDGMTIIQSPDQKVLDINKCRDVLVAVYTDQDIQAQFTKLDELRNSINSEIGQFSAELDDLVIKINGGHVIEGKCGLEN